MKKVSTQDVCRSGAGSTSIPVFRLMIALLPVVFAGCEKLPLPKQTTKEVAAPDSAPPPPSTPPSPERTPEQIVEEFQALQPALRNDENLEELSELAWAQNEMNELILSGGAITDGGAKLLPKFTAVTTLHLAHTPISGAALESVTQMPSLETLVLDGISIGEEPYAALADAPGLTSLSLAETGVGDGVFMYLAELEGLESLNVSGNPLILGGEFSQLVKEDHFAELVHLQAGDTQFGFYGLQQLGRLENLQTLSVAKSAVGNESLQGLRRCTALKELDLSDNNVSDQGLTALTGLKDLEVLHLKGCLAITNDGLKRLRGLRNLRRLSLDGTMCTVEEAQKLKDSSLTEATITLAGQEL
ncbi:MAG: hypothetical protein DWQ41_24610 [Planctomycetota bacterium]|nr:MAG: hypothetical protein DWQ41_24610 [Planctomycetota bacterium]